MGYGLEAALAGISGAARGIAEGYSFEREYAQKDRAISSREEIARLREEIRQMIADANNRTKVDVAGIGAGSRETVAEIGAGSRENVANINQGGANFRHTTVSGDTGAREAGADRRLTRNLTFGQTLEDGRNRRWDTPSGNAALGSETTRRGQDIGAETTRRGQDITSETGRRGQDVRSRDSRYSADKRNAMFQGIFGPVPVTPVGAGSGVQVPDREREEPPPAAAAPPPGARTPVTPMASTPPPSPKTADADVDLETQRRARFEQIKREITERQKKGRDVTDLVKELQKLRSGGAR